MIFLKILHPMTGEEIYWEHFGMMDTQEYRKNAADKINLYVRNGIYPGERLITTYEMQEQLLDTTINFLRFSSKLLLSRCSAGQ